MPQGCHKDAANCENCDKLLSGRGVGHELFFCIVASYKMMPVTPSGIPQTSAVSNIITWIQIMETLAAAASAPIFMRLPQQQLECQGRQVVRAMSEWPVVPQGWKYTACNDPACGHCAIPGTPTPTPIILLINFARVYAYIHIHFILTWNRMSR